MCFVVQRSSVWFAFPVSMHCYCTLLNTCTILRCHIRIFAFEISLVSLFRCDGVVAIATFRGLWPLGLRYCSLLLQNIWLSPVAIFKRLLIFFFFEQAQNIKRSKDEGRSGAARGVGRRARCRCCRCEVRVLQRKLRFLLWQRKHMLLLVIFVVSCVDVVVFMSICLKVFNYCVFHGGLRFVLIVLAGATSKWPL